MIPYSTLILSIYAIQALGTLLALGILLALWRRSHKRQFMFWMLAFLCLSLMVLGKSISLWSMGWESSVARGLMRLTVALASVWQQAFFWQGSRHMLLGSERSSTNSKRVLWLYALATIALIFLIYVTPFEWRISVRSAALSLLCLGSGALVWSAARRQAEPSFGTGAKLAAGGTLGYLAAQAIYMLGASPVEIPFPLGWSWYAGFGDVFFQSIIGLGLFLWHLELSGQKENKTKSHVLRMKTELAQARQAQQVGLGAAEIAHDINNMMSCLQGYSKMALEKTSDFEVASTLREMNGIAERINRLTRQLLSAHQPRDEQTAPLDLSRCILQTEGAMRQLINPSLDLQIHLSQEVPMVLANQAQIEHILLNLLTNSRDACAGSGWIRVELCSVIIKKEQAQTLQVKPGEFARLVFQDSGCGVSEEAKTHIFETFYSTKSKMNGSGIGLSSIRENVRSLGGAIEFIGGLAQGARFEVFLPVITDGLAAPATDGASMLRTLFPNRFRPAPRA